MAGAQSDSSKVQSSKKLRQISWDEVRKHHTKESCWMVYLNKVYDVTQWAPKHPGGDIIYLAGGNDASILISSYHPNGISSSLLDKYCIGEVDKPYKGFYGDIANDEFYNTLKQRVMKYFKDNKKSTKGEGNKEMYIKSAIIMLGYIIGLYLMWFGSYIGAILVGIFSSQIGMCIMHDGSHGAYSKSKFWNWLTCWTMDMISANSYAWEVQHVAGHHIHTNNNSPDSTDIERDLDVFSSYPLIRMHPSSERKWYHKYQHYYSVPLFALFTFSKVLYSDIQYLMDKKIFHQSMETRLNNRSAWIRVISMKIISFIYTMIMPMYYNGIVKGFLLYFIFHNVVGVILACLFQITHLSEGCSFLAQDKQICITDIQKQHVELLRKKHNIKEFKQFDPKSWAALQCRTSSNWGLKSYFWTHFSGGLNHQIEHHLFPSICHVHYRDIQQIVEKTCAEYGVAYIIHDTFLEAFQSLLNYLKKLGNPSIKPY